MVRFVIEIRSLDLYSTQECSIECQLSFHICYFKSIKLRSSFIAILLKMLQRS